MRLQHRRVGLQKATFLTVFLAVVLASTANGQSREFLSMKLTRVQDRRTVEQLETILQEYAAPFGLVRNDRSLEQLLVERCGESRPALLRRAEALNEDDESARIAVPPCLYWQEQADVRIPAGSGVERTVEAWTGYMDWRRALATVLQNPDAVAAGQSIRVRGLAQRQVLELLPDRTREHLEHALLSVAAEVCDIEYGCLHNAAAPAVEARIQIEDVTPESAIPVDFIDLEPEDQVACAHFDAENWPVQDRAAVLELLRLYRSMGITGSGVVAVADTGLPRELVEQFPILRLGADQNIGMRLSGFSDHSKPPYSPEPNRYAAAHHGLLVASIAAGTPLFGAPQPEGWIKLRIYSVLAMMPSGIYGDSMALRDAVERAPRDTTVVTPVVNLSWRHYQEDPEFLAAAQRSTALVVVAAGNDTMDVTAAEGDTIYPATLGAERTILSVAAIRPDQRLAMFSNRGDGAISIAAPGCSLPAWNHLGEVVQVHGTSAAAPLVAFTGALIYALGIQRAADIKARLIASGNYIARSNFETELDFLQQYPNLPRLNVLDSISVRSDIVRYKDGKRETGLISGDFSIISRSSGAEVRIDRILRIWDFQKEASGAFSARADWLKDSTFVRNVPIILEGHPEFTTTTRNELLDLSEVNTIIPKMCKPTVIEHCRRSG